MPEKKWYKGRPVRRTRRIKGNLIKVIFDDGPKGLPGATEYVPENEYAKKDENGNEINLKREFITNKKVKAEELEPVGTA